MTTPEGIYADCRFDRTIPGCALVHISGELDACSAGHVEQEIEANLDPACPRLVLDLGDLEFIDSTGIRLLIQVLHRRKNSGDVIFVRPRERTARRALDVVGFAQVAELVESLEDAIPS